MASTSTTRRELPLLARQQSVSHILDMPSSAKLSLGPPEPELTEVNSPSRVPIPSISPEFTDPDRPAQVSPDAASSSTSAPWLRPLKSKGNMQKHKVALCQLAVTPDKDGNIARARARVDAAADAGAKLVVLPEIWSCPYAMETLQSYAEDVDGGESPSISMLSEVAAARKITIVGGSIPEKASAGKVFNTCCVIGPDGQILAKHRKLHLFEIDIPGDITFKESDTFTGGQQTTVVDTDVGRIGIGICHDIRFPELAMLYRSKGVHLICYPSAFNMSTGELLWDLMQKSRAVDNQLFVATCSPARDPNASSDYMIWGHSSLIGPFGEVLAAAGHEEATVIGEMDLSMIQSTRENLPLEMQRRGDLYRLVDVMANDSMKIKL